MGSAISSPARTGVKTTLRDVAKTTKPKPTVVQTDHAATQSVKHDTRVTARLNVPPVYHRKTNDEWSETLKKISGAISSSSWEGEIKAHMQNQTETERHSAQRSDETNIRLPRRQHNKENARDEHGALIRPEGRLSQNQILQMFNLRRANPERWDVSSVAKKYGLKEEDVTNLLSFTRTYAARIDSDGQVRGYYNSDPENTISRFEKD